MPNYILHYVTILWSLATFSKTLNTILQIIHPCSHQAKMDLFDKNYHNSAFTKSSIFYTKSSILFINKTNANKYVHKSP